jgi:hypothetical protein
MPVVVVRRGGALECPQAFMVIFATDVDLAEPQIARCLMFAAGVV